MKRLVLLSLLFAVAAHAQDEDASVTAERARLKQEHQKADAVYLAEEKACYGKFAVNDCIARAKARRREVVSDLRRQEIALNDAERKRKAAERKRELDEKAAQQKEREGVAPARAASQAGRGLRANERSASRASQAATDAQKAALHDKEVKQREAAHEAAQQRRGAEAAKNAKEHERRAAEAKEREEKARQRTAERKKPAASGLKDPA
jgi:hypothetical protein